MILQEEQINRIRLELEQNGVTLISLRDDLLDHLCCVIEDRMEAGATFDQSLRYAVKDLAPKGLKSIEKETLFLLHYKQIQMKKLIFFAGSIFATLLSAGAIMKVLHLWGGEQFLLVGIAGLLILVVPISFSSFVRLSLSMKSTEGALLSLGTIAAFLIGLGCILKILHLEGAHLSLFIGGILLSFGFIPILSYHLYKKAIV